MRLFALCPRLTKNEERLIASTAWRMRIGLLDAVYRRVIVEPSARKLTIAGRYLWLIHRKREIPFNKIQAVTYGYDDMAMGSSFSYSHDSSDWFTVGLRLVDDSEMHLFYFIGEGTFNNNGPLPDWMYWSDFAFDVSGSQEQESRVFVDLLSKIIGVKVVPPRSY